MVIQGVEMVVHPDLRGLFEGLRSPADVIARWPVPPLKYRTAVTELRLSEGHFFLKVYGYTGLFRLRTLFVTSRAAREHRNLLRMAELGFRVPIPVACGEERTLGMVSDSFVMTRAIEKVASIWTYIHKPAEAPFPLPGPAERRRLIDEFARTLRRAHEEKFFIHSLRSKNVLLTRDGERYALHVIDVPFAGIWRWRMFPRGGRIRDLASVMKWSRPLLTRTERMRFARAYGADRALLRDAQRYQERYYP